MTSKIFAFVGKDQHLLLDLSKIASVKNEI